MTDWVAPDEFEKRVSHVARALWPSAGVAGSVMVAGRERDGLYVTEENIHLVEATALRTLEKAKKDSDKLEALAKSLRMTYLDKAVKLWFVTKDAPTAEQRTECLRKGVTPVSFAEFQQKLIDVRQLLDCRSRYRFGSNDEVGPTGCGEQKYVDFGVSTFDRQVAYKAVEIADWLAKGGRYTLLGDFGAGKSTVLLQIYRKLESEWRKGNSYQFPVFINLRDHYGAEDAVEILDRHAKRIGFESGARLVRAWRAGYCHLLIDGFDEVSPIGASVKKSILKNARREALAAVRDLIRDHPKSCGLIVSGRPHYFDSLEERRAALGTTGFVDLLLNDFTDEQVSLYFKSCGLAGVVPRWLPKRPYLVAILARRGVSMESGIELGPGDGWNYLLRELSAREALIAPAVESEAVREILERLATRARSSAEGLGPITGSEFVETFRDVCGIEPDDRGHQLLARLSGLAIVRSGEESRQFIDEEFADACRAGDVARFCLAPWDSVSDRLKSALRAMGPTGVSVLDALLPEDYSKKLAQQAMDGGCSAVRLDLYNLFQARDISLDVPTVASDVFVGSIEIRGGVNHRGQLTVTDSFIERLVIDCDGLADAGICFKSTYISEVIGPTSSADVPAGFLDEDCSVDSWASAAARNSSVLTELPDLRVAVLVVCLRKLFMQTGNGRQEDALYRGLSLDAQRYVGPVVSILDRARLVSPFKKRGKTLWVPDRSAQARVERVIGSPMTIDDPILAAVRAL